LRIKRSVGITLVGVCLLVLVMAEVHRYHVRDSVSGRLFWHFDEAYLLLETTREGYRPSYLEICAKAVARLIVVFAWAPDDWQTWVTAIRITPNSVEKSTIVEAMDRYAIFEGQLFNGPTRKWVGTHYQQTSPDEQRRFLAGGGRLWPTRDFSNIEGWNHVCCFMPRVYGRKQYPFEVQGKPMQLLVARNDDSGITTLSLQVGNQQPIQLLQFSHSGNVVSKGEYKTLMAPVIETGRSP
jgi:hypothetical protein